jgi:enoyl-CoA hydratase/carnithine racemase
MSDATVHIEQREAGVALMRLDRAPVNALNPAFLTTIDEAMDTLEADGAVRSVVLCAEGKTLSGGMDLKELQGFSADDERAMVQGLNKTYGRIYGFPKPVICAAHGPAIAGGMFFALTSDYRVAGERAVFGLAEIRVAVRFPIGPMEIARHELAPNALRRIMLGGQNHDAATAMALGVVDEVVPTDRVLDRAIEVATSYAGLPPETFASIKRAIRGDVLEQVRAAVEDGADPMLDGWFTEETGDATRAVLASLKK